MLITITITCTIKHVFVLRYKELQINSISVPYIYSKPAVNLTLTYDFEVINLKSY